MDKGAQSETRVLRALAPPVRLLCWDSSVVGGVVLPVVSAGTLGSCPHLEAQLRALLGLGCHWNGWCHLEAALGTWLVLLAGASMELLGHCIALGGSQEGAVQGDKRLQASTVSCLPVVCWSELVKAQSRCGRGRHQCDFLDMCSAGRCPGTVGLSRYWHHIQFSTLDTGTWACVALPRTRRMVVTCPFSICNQSGKGKAS